LRLHRKPGFVCVEPLRLVCGSYVLVRLTVGEFAMAELPSLTQYLAQNHDNPRPSECFWASFEASTTVPSATWSPQIE